MKLTEKLEPGHTYLVLTNKKVHASLEELRVLRVTKTCTKVQYVEEGKSRWVLNTTVDNEWELLEELHSEKNKWVHCQGYSNSEVLWKTANKFALANNLRLPSVVELVRAFEKEKQNFSETFYWSSKPEVAVSFYNGYSFSRGPGTSSLALFLEQ